jgi:hypothetical protein
MACQNWIDMDDILLIGKQYFGMQYHQTPGKSTDRHVNPMPKSIESDTKPYGVFLHKTGQAL